MKQKILTGVLAAALVAALILGIRVTVQNGKLQKDYDAKIAELTEKIDSQAETVDTATADELTAANKKIEELTASDTAMKKLVMQSLDMDLEEENPDDYTLAELIDTLIGNGSYDYGDVHPIWDDTAVVNAYKSGDDSAITDEQSKFVLEKVREIIPTLITDDMSDYDKEFAVYTWLVKYVQFDSADIDDLDDDSSEDYSYLPYGVLKYHSAICVGNSTTFKLFMDCLDIPCQIIHSTEEGEHAWNLVQIDGEWYHVDATFDTIAVDEPSYTYFNVPDSVKDTMGYPWNHDDFPEATSMKANYNYKRADKIADILDLPQYMKDKMNSSCVINIRVSSEDEYYAQRIIDALSNNMMDGYISMNNSMYCEAEDEYLMTVVYENYGNYDPDDPDYTEDDETLQKINEKMQELFGFTVDDYNNIVYTYTDLTD